MLFSLLLWLSGSRRDGGRGWGSYIPITDFLISATPPLLLLLLLLLLYT